MNDPKSVAPPIKKVPANSPPQPVETPPNERLFSDLVDKGGRSIPTKPTKSNK